MGEWIQSMLGEVADYTTGKLNSNAEVPDGEYPFFTCSPVTLRINHYAFDTEALILAGNNANGVFSLKYYNGKFNAYQRTYIISIRSPEVATYHYLFYALQCQLAELEFLSHGTATKYLTLPLLNQIPVSLPPLAEQKAIAAVLSSLDDKIDLLHRQNKTLETLAETLFRQWFVEEAQEDWAEVELDSLVNCVTGCSYKGVHLAASSNALVTLKNFARDGSFRMDGFKEYIGPYKESHLVKPGDLIVAHTDITQEADIIGNPAIVIDPGRYESMISNTLAA